MKDGDLQKRALQLKARGATWDQIRARFDSPSARGVLRAPAAVRETVRARAHGACERCGTVEALRYDIHHITALGKIPENYHAPENLVHLCRSCHVGTHTGWQTLRRLEQQQKHGARATMPTTTEGRAS